MLRLFFWLQACLVLAGVVNEIYGFEPPAPPAFFHFVAAVEAVCTGGCAIATLSPIGQVASRAT